MSDGQRLGIFGGTFDPVHRTHLEIARAAREAAHLDEVLFVVAGHPPHKGYEVFASAEDRLAMVEAAVAGEVGMEPSRLEVDRQGPSYTVDTLRELERAHPDAVLFLIVGQDSLVDLPGWRNPEGIYKRAELLVIRRPGVNAEIPASLSGHCQVVPFDQSNLSSTEVRHRIAAGEDLTEVLPGGVEGVIREKALYDAG